MKHEGSGVSALVGLDGFVVGAQLLNDPPSKFDALAHQIVDHLLSPDVIALEEIQDNSGATDNGMVEADVTLGQLVAAIAAAGGPAYEWRQINPVDDQDGGQPGGNIRVGFMFRTDRGVAFVDRPGGSPTTPTSVVSGASGPELSVSPGAHRSRQLGVEHEPQAPGR
jgi:predicted extracellular nuclease